MFALITLHIYIFKEENMFVYNIVDTYISYSYFVSYKINVYINKQTKLDKLTD